MIRRVLLPLFFASLILLISWPAEAQSARSGRGYRARPQPRSSDDVKLAPGMRLGRPLALTTDYMGRPLKPKPAKAKPGQGASSMSATKTGTKATPAATTTKKAAVPTKNRRR